MLLQKDSLLHGIVFKVPGAWGIYYESVASQLIVNAEAMSLFASIVIY